MTPRHLKAARERLGMTQAQLARELGLHRSSVGKMEIGADGWPIEPRTALAVECLLRRRGLWLGLGQHDVERQ